MLALCYHGVSTTWAAPMSVTPEALERQLTLLLERGYVGATFSETAAARPEARLLAITFDDGFNSTAAVAGPVLERLGLPGTVFVPTDFIGTDKPMSWPGISEWLGGPDESEVMPMDWAQARALADSGWEIGSHSCSHPSMPALGIDELDREMTESRARVEEMMGAPCTSFAYPYGARSPQVVEAALRAGYTATAGLPRGGWIHSQFILPRVGVYHRDGALSFRLKTSPAHAAIRASKAWGLASLVLRGLRREPASF